MVTAVAIVYIRRLDFALIRRNSVIRVTLETVRKDLALMRVRGELIDVDMRAVFVKILQKNWLGVFLSLKNLSRGFAPTLRYPRIFF